MKKHIKIVIAILMTLIMSIGLVACGDNSGGGSNIPPDDSTSKVIDIYIVYNNQKVTSGLISLDLTVETISLSADVKTTDNSKPAVTFSSTETDVAEISNSGVVTLKSKGETIISASAESKKHEVVLVVGNDLAPASKQFTITVTGGTSSLTKAESGKPITLTASISEFEKQHKEFVEWQYLNADTNEPLENLWINGNIFRMPEVNVLINAIYKNKLYTLNVVDGSIKSARTDGEDVNPVASVDGSTKSYNLAYGSNITVESDEEENGEMFVGWDYAARKNRVGAPGQTEYSFEMPDETLTVFGVFSQTSALNFSGVSFTNTKEKITNGKAETAVSADADLEGMNGYHLVFPGNRPAEAIGYTNENFTGVDKFSTLRFGSQTVKTIFKNNSEISMTFEFYAVSYSTVATTGVVTIPANSVKEVMFTAPAGLHNPSFALALREDLKGTSESVSLDIVYETANTYPDGDPQFHVVDAEYVTLQSRVPTASDYPANTGIRGDCYANGPKVCTNPTAPLDGSFGGRKNVNNNNGITNLVTRETYIKYSDGASPFITAKISNLPAYDADNSKITIYFRVMNTNGNMGTFDFGLGTKENPHSDDGRVSYSVKLEAHDTLLFGITIDRASASDGLYFTIVKNANEATGGGNYDYNLIIQMMYNNKIGVQNEDIFTK